MDLTAISEKFVKSPLAILLAALLLLTTMLGTHFATSSDLDKLNSEVKSMRDDLRPLKERVKTLEKDVKRVDSRVDEEISTVEGRLDDASKEREGLRESYHNIEVRLERMSGSQDLTNERLKQIRNIMRQRSEDGQ